MSNETEDLRERLEKAMKHNEVMARQATEQRKKFEERGRTIAKLQAQLAAAKPKQETHLVTLELTGRFDSHPSTWPWESIFNCDIRVNLEPGDSVRVVVDENLHSLIGALTDEERRMLDAILSKAGVVVSPELREALENALRLQWPHTAEQMKVLARCTGPSCVVPENHYKAAIRAFLEATK